MLVEIEITAELPFHERKRPRYRSARCSDFVDGMGRLELYPVDAGLVTVASQPLDRVLQRPIRGVASITLRHHHEIRVEFVFHVDGCTVAHNRLVERHDLDAGALRLALAFDGLVVDTYSGNAEADAFAHDAAHCHDAAVTGVAVHDHRDRHAVGDPAGDRH